MQNIAKKAPQKDAVDQIIDQWKQQGFDSNQLIDMETIGRLKRVETLLMRQLANNYKKHYGLAHWEFDVLATLRRSGQPYCLSPTELFASMMVSSGTMTNRLQQLQTKQLISRCENTQDKRSLLVALTDQGIDLINKIIKSHIDLENQLLASLSYEESSTLNMLLRKVESNLPKID